MLEVAQKYLQLKSGEYYKCFGKVDKVVGLTIESIGPKAKLNDLCMIFLDKERRDYVMSEVVGFKDSHIILMPFDNVEGVGVGCIVENTGHLSMNLMSQDLSLSWMLHIIHIMHSRRRLLHRKS